MKTRTSLYHDPEVIKEVRKIAIKMKRSLTSQIDCILEDYVKQVKEQANENK